MACTDQPSDCRDRIHIPLPLNMICAGLNLLCESSSEIRCHSDVEENEVQSLLFEILWSVVAGESLPVSCAGSLCDSSRRIQTALERNLLESLLCLPTGFERNSHDTIPHGTESFVDSAFPMKADWTTDVRFTGRVLDFATSCIRCR